jgi:hypothetical protein
LAEDVVGIAAPAVGRMIGQLARPASQAEEAAQISVIDEGVGVYGEVGGHHIHAQAAFRGHPNYDPDAAISISQDYVNSDVWIHDDMTARQRELFRGLATSGRPNTMREQNRIAVEALMAGGATREEARQLVAESLWNLRAQGVRAPTRIPWYSP